MTVLVALLQVTPEPEESLELVSARLKLDGLTVRGAVKDLKI
jgi:hypothetical protein